MDKNVGNLEVSVHDVEARNILEPLISLPHHLLEFSIVEGTMPLQVGLKIASVAVLSYYVAVVTAREHLIATQNVRMFQALQNIDFGLEKLHKGVCL